MTVAFDLVTDIDAPIEVVFDLARDPDLCARSMAHTGERAVGGRMTGRIDAGETVTQTRNAALQCEAETRET